MKITYISHSGFAVELENHNFFLFDYYKGEIPKFDPEKKYSCICKPCPS
mgnify:CR=1 FL=1